LRWRHLGHQKASAKVSNPASTTPDTGAFDAFDVFADWKINDQLSLGGGLTNLLDRDPPVVGGVAGSTDANTYDTLGRSYYISLKVAL
jgi:iron complex outermembrane receptor protein